MVYISDPGTDPDHIRQEEGHDRGQDPTDVLGQGHFLDPGRDREGDRPSEEGHIRGQEVDLEVVEGQGITDPIQGHPVEGHSLLGLDDDQRQDVEQGHGHHTPSADHLRRELLGVTRPTTKKMTDIRRHPNPRRKVLHHSQSHKMNTRCLKNIFSKLKHTNVWKIGFLVFDNKSLCRLLSPTEAELCVLVSK